MFHPGSILVITEKPDVLFVTVRKNHGAIQGLGWLLYTEEGNYILVRGPVQGYLEKVTFITDPEKWAELLDKARN